MREHLDILLRLLPYTRRYTFRIVLMSLCTFLSSVTRVGGLVLIKPFGDLVLGTFDVAAYAQIPGLRSGIGHTYLQAFADTLQQAPNTALLLLIALLLGLVAIQSFSQFAAVYLQTYLGGRIAIDLKREMLSHLFMQPITYYSMMGRGMLHRIIAEDS